MNNSKSRCFDFTTHNNGGESLNFVMRIEGNDAIQEISLQSYCNSATFTISDLITPKQLRQLADELDAFIANHPEAFDID